MHTINDNYHLKDLGYSNADNTIVEPRHRWYFYKEGFSPQLVKQAIAINSLNEDSVILDPFNGSGTTTLTASLDGIESIGIEVNPFTSFLSEVKQIDITAKKIINKKEDLYKALNNKAKSDLIGFSTFSEKEILDKWLFNKEILNTFEAGWQYTNSLKSKKIKQVFRFALIHAAMSNCNAKRDGKCLRYREGWENNNYNKDSFVASLSEKINQMIEDVDNYPISKSSEIYNNDSRLLISSLAKNTKFDLCITSPPYLNTFDYTDIYRPELFLGKFISTKNELYNHRLNTVRSHIQAKWPPPINDNFGLLYENIVSKVKDKKNELMSKRIPEMIQAYFEDMKKILENLKGMANKNASLWIVVSTSAYAGIEIPVDLILGDIGANIGWKLQEIGVLRYLRKRKTKYSTNINQLRESVIIFNT